MERQFIEDYEQRSSGVEEKTEFAKREHIFQKAAEFMTACGLDPTPDAIAQLTDAFLPALQIVCERGYDPKGATWREGGWMPIVIEVRKKAARLWFRCWRNGKPPWTEDHPVDLINYCGMLMRSDGLAPWGSWGQPHDFNDDFAVEPIDVG
jgi:hypothetical protein